ncbi:PHP domain-containing protein [Pseudohongiella nitratireducens]|uniref:PHP domain-containing protein n=1 Tax=Pseudohongiella nitratireducens TaxID=1768907 RepID=UPI00083B7176|nr:PHP domain-containing protein [Pseudohongiella nitratireducens]
MIDLHSHTHFSDGDLSPSRLLSRAHERGLEYLAITDHDSVTAFHTLRAERHAHASKDTNPDDSSTTSNASGTILRLPQLSGGLISGVEVSCQWEGLEIHVLGLFVDVDNVALTTMLQQQQQRRRERAAAIDLKLQRNGMTGLGAYLDTLPCDAISRSHVADFLVNQGHSKNKQHAFNKLIGRKGKAYVAAGWCEFADAIATIHEAGGIASLAHPDRYPLSRPRFRRMVEDYCEAGGDAIEVSYSNLNPGSLGHLAELCEKHELWATAGSDFHSPDHHWMDLGKIRMMPAACRHSAIWHHPAWQQHIGKLPAIVSAGGSEGSAISDA